MQTTDQTITKASEGARCSIGSGTSECPMAAKALIDLWVIERFTGRLQITPQSVTMKSVEASRATTRHWRCPVHAYPDQFRPLDQYPLRLEFYAWEQGPETCYQ